MSEKINIIVVPLDDRPVTYSLPVEISLINNDVNIISPPRDLLGNLDKYADTDKIKAWFEDIINSNKIDYIILSLDTFLYGGLIPSRRIDKSLEDLENELLDIKNLLFESKRQSGSKIFAFSSIMRISNNNINEEEKLYWDKYGELLYKYSFLSHKLELNPENKEFQKLDLIKSKIPCEILDDYLSTRQRNFEINKNYIDFVNENIFDYLVYSLDDTGQYGLNVKEARHFEDFVQDSNLSSLISIKTGADEIILSLLSKVLTDFYNKKLSIMPVYSTIDGKNIVSRYEDKTIENSLKGQIELAGCIYTENYEDADMIIYVNTPVKIQNDHAMQIYNDVENSDVINFINHIKNELKPCFFVDVSHANGADYGLTKHLIESSLINKFYSYSAWNTTGNSLGSAIFTSVLTYLSKIQNAYCDIQSKKNLFIRLCDDWIYQSLIRQEIREITNIADVELLNHKLLPYAEFLATMLNLQYNIIKFIFPWHRTFEVEIIVE